ncbi:DegT/DnrJ/EryC1/StrS family aminotransferase [Sphingomonas sp. MMSM20]|uniref:DegT/DnrJ/EryC1/StrS family aminotransferase n=1 Tax=Sphingomonas lycopersici TaxID=2951807 RepID=UPI002237C245|nr:DegT/DnrJ/EryC1/StrS family aminotransferase [Sphingomonas lycopersici]MCW6531217.1 DegT/DnrJ/EryC1/StrS family aminotransferase [Sphingomonas lycopersici]
MSIPFVDLHAQYLSLKDEIDAAIARTIANSSFVRGPDVESFEAEYSSLMDIKHTISCANGTDALYIAMKALGVKPGDEVITTAQSWISTSETIGQHGATPIFVDVDPVTSTIDVAKIAERITSRTVGIIPVHLYGQMADMPAIMNLAGKHGLWVIEDCAQAHLATIDGRKAGQFGTITTWSFYPGKNLGAMGDAGAITTNDDALARHMACFARHGGLVKGDHEMEGINSRLDGLQAAILRVKLPHLSRWTRERRAIAKRYDALLADIPGIATPTEVAGREHVYHLYVIEADNRDALAAALKDRGIPTVINYKRALPFLPAYAHLRHTPADFPVAHRLQGRILSLPIFAELNEEQQDAIVAAVRAVATA